MGGGTCWWKQAYGFRGWAARNWPRCKWEGWPWRNPGLPRLVDTTHVSYIINTTSEMKKNRGIFYTHTHRKNIINATTQIPVMVMAPSNRTKWLHLNRKNPISGVECEGRFHLAAHSRLHNMQFRPKISILRARETYMLGPWMAKVRVEINDEAQGNKVSILFICFDVKSVLPTQRLNDSSEAHTKKKR